MSEYSEVRKEVQHEADLVMQEDIINTRIAKIRTEKDAETKCADSAEKRNGKAIMHLLELGRSVKEVAGIFNMSEAEINKVIHDISSSGDDNSMDYE